MGEIFYVDDLIKKAREYVTVDRLHDREAADKAMEDIDMMDLSVVDEKGVTYLFRRGLISELNQRGRPSPHKTRVVVNGEDDDKEKVVVYAHYEAPIETHYAVMIPMLEEQYSTSRGNLYLADFTMADVIEVKEAESKIAFGHLRVVETMQAIEDEMHKKGTETLLDLDEDTLVQINNEIYAREYGEE